MKQQDWLCVDHYLKLAVVLGNSLYHFVFVVDSLLIKSFASVECGSTFLHY